MKLFARLIIACALIGAFPLAAGIVVAVNIDENGNGSYTINNVTTQLSHSLTQDPGPGGLANVLIYSGLPLAGVQGDLGLTDADVGGSVLDVIRWNGDGTIAFYSDNLDGFDSLADTAAPPSGLYTNFLTIPEVGPEGNNGAVWTPAAGQPGYGNSDFTFTYNITSDSVPEPGSMALVPFGLVALGLLARRRAMQDNCPVPTDKGISDRSGTEWTPSGSRR
jgi:hypothetical protein